jgi:O-antigen ligase
MSAEVAVPVPIVGGGGSVRRNLLLVALASLPFTYALTVNLRFPLKLYEVALALALLTGIIELRLPVAPGMGPVARRLAWFLAAASLVTLLRFAVPAEGASIDFGSRFGPAGDAIAKLLYLCLAIGGMLLFSRLAYHHESAFIRAWLVGAILAAAYSWYLALCGLAGFEPFLLPGIDVPKYATVAGRSFVRSGTFQEGNFLGLYLLVSCGIAVYARRPVMATILGLTILWTFSTVNVLALGLLCLILWWQAHAGRSLARRLVYVTLGAVVLLAALALLLQTGYLQAVVIDKLATDDPGSKVKRVALILAGTQMFLDHPVLGVGISQFGYYYNAYQPLGRIGVAQTVKLIPNNIYVELLAELGIMGLTLFGLFLWSVYRRLGHPALSPLRATFIATLFAFNAFPTYSVMFFWAFLGLALGASARVSRTVTSMGDP